MPDGAPAALLLTEECTRTVYAVQLLPPFVWEDPLPPLDVYKRQGILSQNAVVLRAGQQLVHIVQQHIQSLLVDSTAAEHGGDCLLYTSRCV